LAIGASPQLHESAAAAGRSMHLSLPVVSPRRARERLSATRLPLHRRAMQTSQANHVSGGSDALSDVYAQLDWATKRYDDMQRRFEGLREAFDFAGVLKIDLETGEAMLKPRDRSEQQLERACAALTGGWPHRGLSGSLASRSAECDGGGSGRFAR
jgi:hypothetical protein